MAQETTLKRRVADVVRQHGGLRKAARALGMTPQYLWRLGEGEKDNPSDAVLRKLGLKRQVVYWMQ
jgi:hypothetical protein